MEWSCDEGLFKEADRGAVVSAPCRPTGCSGAASGKPSESAAAGGRGKGGQCAAPLRGGPQGHRAGLAIGQPLANARAMLPALKVVAANEPDDVELLTRIADWCDRFTPYVALDGPRGLLLDVTGAAHLFGGEQAMLDRIRESLQAQGFAVRGAMAGTAIAARAFARYRDGAVIAPAEKRRRWRRFPSPRSILIP